jgi:SNF2 family DNA or RNA helicase
VARAALPDLARLCESLGEAPPPAARALRELAETSEAPPPAALPADLTATLRGYQQRGVDWLCRLRDAGLGALLADDMGLGKTLQALCALRGRSLVVAPTSVLHNWAAELARFRPALRCALHHGSARRLEPQADVTLTSYAILRLDVESLEAVDWDTVILDESQAIKNADSQAARAAFRLPAGFRRGAHRHAGGEPSRRAVESDALREPGPARRPTRLRGALRASDRGGRRRGGGTPAGAHPPLRAAPSQARRGARSCRRGPTSCCAPSSARASARSTRAVRAATRSEVLEKLAAGAAPFQALEALLRLRQAACHPALVPGQHATSSAKLELLVETLEESMAEGHRALVFSQWTSLLDLVEPALRAAGIGFGRLDGSTRDRGAVVAAFQAEDGPPVLLVSLKAGGTGLNLTAADTVFILDPWWNPAVEDQAADRAHRIGQDRPVLVHRLVAEDTVEERILALQVRKRGLAEAALGDAARAGAITREELIELLA